MKVGDLFVKLDFKSNLGVLKTAKTGLQSVNRSALMATGTVSAMALAFGAFARSTFNSTNTLSSFASSTGLSALKLQRFGQIAKLSGSSAETLQSSIEGIQSAQANLRLGKGNIQAWALLGLSPNDDPFTTIDKLRGTISKIKSPQELSQFKQFLSGVGVSEKLLPFLRLTNKEFSKLRGRTTILSEADIRSAEQGRQAFASLGFQASKFRDQMIAAVAPVIVQNLQSLNKFLRENKESIVGFIKVGVSGLKNFISVIKAVADGLGGFKNVLIALGVAWAAIKISSIVSGLTLLAANPFFLGAAAIGAAIWGIAKALQAVYKWLKKNDAFDNYSKNVSRISKLNKNMQGAPTLAMAGGDAVGGDGVFSQTSSGLIDRLRQNESKSNSNITNNQTTNITTNVYGAKDGTKLAQDQTKEIKRIQSSLLK